VLRRGQRTNKRVLCGEEGVPRSLCDRVISGFCAADLRRRCRAKLRKDGNWKDRPKICPYHRIPVDVAGATAALQSDHIARGPIPAGGLKDVHHLGTVGQGHATSKIVIRGDATLANWANKKNGLSIR